MEIIGLSTIEPVFSFPNFAYDLSYKLRKLNIKGNLVYEYNPFRNYRLAQDKNGIKSGSLVDFSTKLLNFDLNHPLTIDCQASYDGSTNLIINDDLNPPRLINSRFTPLENNTYEIIDRSGNNDTNIYDENQFDIDTSLYKRTTTIPKIEFNGLGTDGNLSVGNYVFYFKYCDADGNETDFIEESGIVSCHIGIPNDPFSIRGGLRDENSKKSVNFTLSNLDPNYEFLIIYGTRSTADVDGNEQTSAFKIDKQYQFVSNITSINITGYENQSEISINEINTSYNVMASVKAQTQCQNMLFLGNTTKANLPYQDLSDLSLRFLPSVNLSANIGNVDSDYEDSSGAYEYYNALNIYNKLGYWEDIYRLGITYIMSDNSLSPTFNIRGAADLDVNFSKYADIPVYEDGVRKYIAINEEDNTLSDGVSQLENCKGVVKLSPKLNNAYNVIGLQIKAKSDVIKELTSLGIKGFFFVRQKRIPTILTQAITIGLERESCLPTLPLETGYLMESFINKAGVLSHNFEDHKKIVNAEYVNVKAALCPEFELNQSLYNQIFTGSEFTINDAQNQPIGKFKQSISNNRLFNISNYQLNSTNRFRSGVKIMAIGDNIQMLINKNQKYRSRSGEAEDASKFNFAKKETLINYTNNPDNNLIRGSFGAYLGLDDYEGDAGKIINIYNSNFDQFSLINSFVVRYNDNSPYFSIGNRIDLTDYKNKEFSETFYRGDCYICNYTHRMQRNFQDPEAPTNDLIIDQNTWKDNYTKGDAEKNAKINRGDVNAVQLGHWVTFKVRSNINLSMRDVDRTYPMEEGLTGLPRNFFPLYSASCGGESKIPESSVVNAGFNSTTSDKYNFILPDIPAIKNNFDTRIAYSDIHINDAFKNGFRVFGAQNYRDYPRTYGGIIKLIELFGNLLVIFEHGVGLIPVNERAVAGDGSGGNVFINTSNVLPENPKMLSDTFGSQWAESVVKTPYYVYGIDTVGKKIWRTNGSQFEIISDFKVQQFLNQNITLTEKELTPIIGIRNVKSHYNKFKQDVMFTFYDNLTGFEEKAWNLCYNEILQKFVTLYSWMPSYSSNIHNTLFSFDRNTSKELAKLWSSKVKENIYISNTVINDNTVGKVVGILNLSEDRKPQPTKAKYSLVFSLERDNFGNFKKFEIKLNETTNLYELKIKEKLEDKVYLLNIKCSVNMTIADNPSLKEYIASYENYQTINSGYYQNSLAVATHNTIYPTESSNGLTTAFWKHGQAGIFDVSSKLLPCNWYGKQHPFEYECIMADKPSNHKVFNAIKIISDKVKPDSFHYEIIGDIYDWSDSKKNMYFRQEALKSLYQFNGSDILYNKNYLDITPEQRELLYSKSTLNAKEDLFPLTYARVDTFNEIEDYYQSKTSMSNDYQCLSGSEVIYDAVTGIFKIATHVKANPFGWRYNQEISKDRYDALILQGYKNIFIKDSKYYEIMEYGRLRGNMDYLESKWDISIPSIIHYQKNEENWTVNNPLINNIKYPPLNLQTNPLPADLPILEIPSKNNIPPELVNLGYDANEASFDLTDWKNVRKETKLRDKYLKIRVRYSGDELTRITALKTLYDISYA